MTHDPKLAMIPLGDGTRVAVVDAQDYERLAHMKWYLRDKRPGEGGKYAVTSVGPKWNQMRYVPMQRFMFDTVPDGLVVDHINGNGLDNRRSNLRLVTVVQNNWNAAPHQNARSKFKGVAFHKARGKWYARIACNGRRTLLGYFDREIDAATAYNEAASTLHGEFARLNEAARPRIQESTPCSAS